MPLKSSLFLNVVVSMVGVGGAVAAATRPSLLPVQRGPRWMQDTRSAIDGFRNSAHPKFNHF